MPGIYDPTLADEDLRVEHRGRAYEMVRRLAREEGLLVGISSGAALGGDARASRARLDATASIVTVFPGRRGEVPDRAASGRADD